MSLPAPATERSPFDPTTAWPAMPTRPMSVERHGTGRDGCACAVEANRMTLAVHIKARIVLIFTSHFHLSADNEGHGAAHVPVDCGRGVARRTHMTSLDWVRSL